jgi:hypothetical protein
MSEVTVDGIASEVLLQPKYGRSHHNLAILEDCPERATSPLGIHRLLQTWTGFIHPFTGFCFSQDTYPACPNA